MATPLGPKLSPSDIEQGRIRGSNHSLAGTVAADHTLPSSSYFLAILNPLAGLKTVQHSNALDCGRGIKPSDTEVDCAMYERH